MTTINDLHRGYMKLSSTFHSLISRFHHARHVHQRISDDDVNRLVRLDQACQEILTAAILLVSETTLVNLMKKAQDFKTTLYAAKGWLGTNKCHRRREHSHQRPQRNQHLSRFNVECLTHRRQDALYVSWRPTKRRKMCQIPGNDSSRDGEVSGQSQSLLAVLRLWSQHCRLR